MTNLQQMEYVWNNLEESYQNNLKRGNKLTRREFVKRLAAFKDGKVNFAILRSLLSDEILDYSVEETQRYNELFNKIQGVGNYLKAVKKEIESFDIVNEEQLYSIEDENSSISKIMQLINNPNQFCCFLNKETVPAREFIQKGIFTNTVYKENDSLITVNFDNSDPNYISFSTMQDILIFLQKYDKKLVEINQFYTAVHAIIVYKITKEECLEDLVFLSKSMGVLDKNYFQVGDYKIKTPQKSKTEVPNYTFRNLSKDIIEIEKLEFYQVKVKGKFDTHNIIIC